MQDLAGKLTKKKSDSISISPGTAYGIEGCVCSTMTLRVTMYCVQVYRSQDQYAKIQGWEFHRP